MFCGQSFRIGGFHGDHNGAPKMVAAVVMPVSDGQLAFGDDVLEELSEFGCSVVVPCGHAVFG